MSSLLFKEGWNSYEQVRRVTAEEAAGEAEQNIRITHNVRFVISASETWPFDVAPAFVWKFDFQNCDSFVRTRAKSELISEIFCNISLRCRYKFEYTYIFFTRMWNVAKRIRIYIMSMPKHVIIKIFLSLIIISNYNGTCNIMLWINSTFVDKRSWYRIV